RLALAVAQRVRLIGDEGDEEVAAAHPDLVVVELVVAVATPLLQHHHAQARLRQLAGHRRAAGAAADDHDVDDLAHPPCFPLCFPTCSGGGGVNPTSANPRPPRLPPCFGSPNAPSSVRVSMVSKKRRSPPRPRCHDASKASCCSTVAWWNGWSRWRI